MNKLYTVYEISQDMEVLTECYHSVSGIKTSSKWMDTFMNVGSYTTEEEALQSIKGRLANSVNKGNKYTITVVYE